MHRRQPEPGPLPWRLGGEERLEEVRERGRIHSHAGIGDLELDVRTATREVHGESGGRLDAPAEDGDSEGATIGHGVPRVEAQVPQDHDLDLAIAEMIANQVFQMHKVDVRKQQVEWTRLVFGCERAKR